MYSFFEGFFSVDETVKSIPVLCSKVPGEFLHLMAKYTLPFSKPVKSDHN